MLQPTMMQHGPGLAASPPVRNNLEVGGEKYSIAARIPHVSSFLQTALSKLPRKKISAWPCLIERDSPDRVLAFVEDNRPSRLTRLSVKKIGTYDQAGGVIFCL